MGKKYFAAYGSKVPLETLWSCVGYFKALKNERILQGGIIFGREENSLQEASSRSGQDSLYVLRTEVEDEGKLSPRIKDLKKTYPSLEFLIHDSDIE